jgi:hypothetical protein
MGGKKMVKKMKYGVSILAILSLFLLSGCSSTPMCGVENRQITVGTLSSDGKCCAGLEAKSPEGFTGGAWCVKPECSVKCVNTEILTGAYIVCPLGVINSNQTADTYTKVLPACPT